MSQWCLKVLAAWVFIRDGGFGCALVRQNPHGILKISCVGFVLQVLSKDQKRFQLDPNTWIPFSIC